MNRSVKQVGNSHWTYLATLRLAMGAPLAALVALPALHLAPMSSAAAEAADEGLVEEILVTARYREQGVQDVGVSVKAFSQDDIDQLGIYRPERADPAHAQPEHPGARPEPERDEHPRRDQFPGHPGPGALLPARWHLSRRYAGEHAGRRPVRHSLFRPATHRDPAGAPGHTVRRGIERGRRALLHRGPEPHRNRGALRNRTCHGGPGRFRRQCQGGGFHTARGRPAGRSALRRTLRGTWLPGCHRGRPRRQRPGGHHDPRRGDRRAQRQLERPVHDSARRLGGRIPGALHGRSRRPKDQPAAERRPRSTTKPWSPISRSTGRWGRSLRPQ